MKPEDIQTNLKNEEKRLAKLKTQQLATQKEISVIQEYEA